MSFTVFQKTVLVALSPSVWPTKGTRAPEVPLRTRREKFSQRVVIIRRNFGKHLLAHHLQREG